MDRRKLLVWAQIMHLALLEFASQNFCSFPHTPPSGYKMAAAASQPMLTQGRRKSSGTAIPSCFIGNRISISRISSRFLYSLSLCPDWCHMATCSCKGDPFRLVTSPALERRKSRVDIDSVSSTCVSFYSVNTLKAGTMFCHALCPYYAKPSSFPRTLLDTERSGRGRASKTNPCLIC